MESQEKTENPPDVNELIKQALQPTEEDLARYEAFVLWEKISRDALRNHRWDKPFYSTCFS